MRTPAFWHQKDSWNARMLLPFGALYYAAHRVRMRITKPYRAPIPVICVGNCVAGGAGKTPIVSALARILRERGEVVHIISRGYGGSITKAIRVQADIHHCDEVGDEPLLLARSSPVWVGRDRRASIEAAHRAGATMIVMDDGFQNPTIHKDISFLVVDGGYGTGNGRMIPAGPMREPFAQALARADVLVLMGKDDTLLIRNVPRATTLLRAEIVPTIPDMVRDVPLLAFAGIGRPDKFFTMLHKYALNVQETVAFSDHHPYSAEELMQLQQRAHALGATLVTTEKDWVRLDASSRASIVAIPIEVRTHPDTRLTDMLDVLLANLEYSS
ncbi:MAG: tetraacyldisaccharide 4'-kinase [Alphaproteobacteria bacterium]|nr:MAG: tetraacyldisaccharide 4'-kinase [Alphaproteobacteria bacterium]TAF15361.1 MAG: tetraacyldisaccharide 4'-kinase [Alphaproteobacteria bacterium]TAF39309.1 MAG: tetraacyldisaccharide 4'-kinase [Alphaproteobacteria bacterium]TAF75005.1 MAG: tetraacyldisaccharide 4'-kinase [Alphaproteobacteria bacterium]